MISLPFCVIAQSPIDSVARSPLGGNPRMSSSSGQQDAEPVIIYVEPAKLSLIKQSIHRGRQIEKDNQQLQRGIDSLLTVEKQIIKLVETIDRQGNQYIQAVDSIDRKVLDNTLDLIRLKEDTRNEKEQIKEQIREKKKVRRGVELTKTTRRIHFGLGVLHVILMLINP